MKLRFAKADPANDSHYTPDDVQVLVTPSEVPIEPVYPEDGQEYWDEFDHALERGLAAIEKAPDRTTIAECFQDIGIRNAYQAAQSVRADWPSDLLRIGAKDAVSKGATYRDLGMVPGMTSQVAMLDACLAIAGLRTAPSSFCYKDLKQVPRLEEVAAAIARGELECPARTGLMLKKHPRWDKVADDPTQFTLYPGIGCPNHASCGAMHSAAAAAGGLVLKTFLQGDHVAEIADRCTLNVGDFRIDALVHTKQDNNIGFFIGSLSVERWLPDWLASWGADRERVIQVIEEVKTDWVNLV